ncbi:hypothetical protein [Haloquadratum walsbyi]|jgi:hypothetical protein|uniref:hypothetical protein n=1 Tax=Haloquadratum walsbyi TaxID=293091 RepID=UPI0015F4C304|nr:hypothetical protein [Haloquadratum walsbyi]
MTTSEKYRSDLLIEVIAERLQFDRISEVLPGSVYPPYLLVTIGLFIEYGVFDVYNFVVSGKSSFLSQPNSLAIPAMTIIGVIGLKYIHDSYADAVVNLGIEEENIDIDETIRNEFEGLVSFRLRLLGYVATLLAFYAFSVFVITISELIEISGIGLVLYAQLVDFPLIIVPVLYELGISYLAIHINVPRRIVKADFGLFYYDPENLGGFKPVGQLLKRSYYLYTIILLLWFLQSHTPVLLADFLMSPYPPPGPVFQLALSGVWAVGVLTIAYSMYRTHSIMKQKKDTKLRELKRELKTAVKDPYDATLTNIEDREQYEEAQEMISHVKNTQTYPTTFTMWSQIFLSVLLPQALNMVVQLPS